MRVGWLLGTIGLRLGFAGTSRSFETRLGVEDRIQGGLPKHGSYGDSFEGSERVIEV